ncbi:hypothetical protein DFQ27_009380 [Actinomortierella ambigua]|uniref:Lysine-specific metallo-endopeptidase domain-containing protein n=1 Tax=Actinomortierella ambigua TaxID=1343610 RepID=A0A9P6TWR2_9FUNG|nr:hypothetical protein DFQ27_009380 [Actinomortierella ambigua]
MKSVIFSALLLMPAVVRAAEFVQCTTEQQNDINDATNRFKTLVTDSQNYLANLAKTSSGTPAPSPSPRYTTWFGTYTDRGSEDVQNFFDHLSRNNFNFYTFSCTCNDDPEGGYVHVDEFGKVRLCSGFLKAPSTGTDSKAGILIRLATRFSQNGQSRFDARNQEQCKELAMFDERAAVLNAYNLQYFAENNPPEN